MKKIKGFSLSGEGRVRKYEFLRKKGEDKIIKMVLWLTPGWKFQIGFSPKLFLYDFQDNWGPVEEDSPNWSNFAFSFLILIPLCDVFFEAYITVPRKDSAETVRLTREELIQMAADKLAKSLGNQINDYYGNNIDFEGEVVVIEDEE